MNVIFTFIFLISLVVFAVFSPDKALEAMTGGGQKAVGLSMSLIVIYAVWSGVLQIAEDSGIIKKLSVKLRRPIQLLFGELTDDESDDVAVNISANLLGMGGIATPAGISATTKMCNRGNHDGATRLFVLASTSIQLLPTTVISLRQSFSSAAPAMVFLPSLLASLLCTATGLSLCFIFKSKNGKTKNGKSENRKSENGKSENGTTAKK